MDFQKAFDSVSRPILWKVIRKLGIKGKLYNTLHKMYESVKACVRCNGTLTDYISRPGGLKQGCLISPILFSFFIYEFKGILQNSGLRGIRLLPDWTEIFLFIYADAVALISDTIIG